MRLSARAACTAAGSTRWSRRTWDACRRSQLWKPSEDGSRRGRGDFLRTFACKSFFAWLSIARIELFRQTHQRSLGFLRQPSLRRSCRQAFQKLLCLGGSDVLQNFKGT